MSHVGASIGEEFMTWRVGRPFGAAAYCSSAEGSDMWDVSMFVVFMSAANHCGCSRHCSVFPS